MTRSHRIRYFVLVVFLGFITLVGDKTVSFAQPVNLNSGDLIPGTVWTVQFASPITLQFDAAVNNFTTAGTLIETTTRTNLDPLTIHFQQAFETPTSSASGGLRLLFQEQVTNNTLTPWVGYVYDLIDVTPGPDTSPTAVHPSAPHFHPDTSGATFAPFNPQNLPDPALSLTIEDGVNQVAIGGNMNAASLLLHERQYAIGIIPDPGRRNFDLVETPLPTPEPGTISLMAGLLLVGGACLRKHRKKTVS